MNCYTLIVAGGKGLRMGGDIPKQFLPLGGRPILMHTIETFRRALDDVQIVLVLPADQHDYWHELCRENGFRSPELIANGGETRFHSVRNGLSLLPEGRYDTALLCSRRRGKGRRAGRAGRRDSTPDSSRRQQHHTASRRIPTGADTPDLSPCHAEGSIPATVLRSLHRRCLRRGSPGENSHDDRRQQGKHQDNDAKRHAFC